MPFSRCDEEDTYACEVVEMLQTLRAGGDWTRVFSITFVCLTYLYEIVSFAGEGVKQATHWKQDCDVE